MRRAQRAGSRSDGGFYERPLVERVPCGVYPAAPLDDSLRGGSLKGLVLKNVA